MMHTIHDHYAFTHDSSDKFMCKRTKKKLEMKKNVCGVRMFQF